MMNALDTSFDPAEEKKLVDWLNFHIGQEKFRPGFLRLEKMVGGYRQELEQRALPVVIIGGTNGKGETSHSLAFLLKSQQISYALWTSPHVLSVRERIQVNGGPVSYETLWKSVLHCYHQLQKKNIQNPTYYEFMLMVFMDVMLSYSTPIEFCLLEVGLGGRLDGVNFFSPHLTSITSISRDHENILGKGYKNILQEKLGITRPEIPLVTALELDYCRQRVDEYCREKSIPWVDLFAKGICRHEDNYSQRNQLLAFTLFTFLQKNKKMMQGELSPEEIRHSWENFSFPRTKGRSETMTLGERRFIFIGAHNIDGMRKLRSMVEQPKMTFGEGHGRKKAPPYDLILLSFSNRPLSEIRNLIRILLTPDPLGAEIVVTTFNHERAVKWETLLQLKQFPEGGQVRFCQQWEEVFTNEQEKVQATTKHILVTGSYYFIGVVESWLLCKGDRGSEENPQDLPPIFLP